MRRKAAKKALIFLIVLLVLSTMSISCSVLASRRAAADTPTLVSEPPSRPTAEVALQVSPTVIAVPDTPTPLPTNTPVIIVLPTDTPTATPTARPQPMLASPSQPQGVATNLTPIPAEALTNGTFEEGFSPTGVANGWEPFQNGEADFVWGDTTWDVAVWEGSHAQLMRIHNPLKSDRYIGIFQRVSVLKGHPYELTFHGLIQSSEGSAEVSKWGNRIQWAVDYNGGTDWQAITRWTDVGWDDYPLLDGSSIMGDHKVTITPTSDTLTLFLRGWKKWAHTGSVANFYLDGVSLKCLWVDEPCLKEPSKLPVTGLAPGLILLAGVLGLLVIAFRQAREVIAWRRGE